MLKSRQSLGQKQTKSYPSKAQAETIVKLFSSSVPAELGGSIDTNNGEKIQVRGNNGKLLAEQ